jgi:hypothetical protein
VIATGFSPTKQVAYATRVRVVTGEPFLAPPVLRKTLTDRMSTKLQELLSAGDEELFSGRSVPYLCC